VHKAYTMCLYRPPALELTPIVTHHTCPHNIYVGLTARHLVANNPAPDWTAHTSLGTIMLKPDEVMVKGITQEGVLHLAYEVANEWVGDRRIDLAPTDAYIAKFGGPKRQRLIRAINRAQVEGLDYKVKGFVKCDKYDTRTAAEKAPRMIQFRDPGVNAELAKFMGPAEHTLLLGPGYGPSGTPDSSKGMNMTRRARVWHTKRHVFHDGVCIMGDFSKFDAHVSTIALRLEHHVWRRISGLPLKMLDNQLINHGRAGPHKYNAVGTRMSGDRNTGGGNTIIVVVLLRLVARLVGCPMEILVDGDDHNIWIPRRFLEDFTKTAEAVFTKLFSQRWVAVIANGHWEEEYCHSALSYNEAGDPICVVDPVRHMERALWVVNREGGRQLAEILVGNLVSTYLMFPHTPVVSRACYSILESLGVVREGAVDSKYSLGTDDQWVREKRLRHTVPHLATINGRVTTRLPSDYLRVSEESRDAVHALFGITPDEQVRLERDYGGGTANPVCKFKKLAQRPSTAACEELRDTNDHVALWEQ